MPATAIAAASRMFAALNTMPPRNALPKFAADACFRLATKPHSGAPPKLPNVKPETSAKSSTPST